MFNFDFVDYLCLVSLYLLALLALSVIVYIVLKCTHSLFREDVEKVKKGDDYV